MGIQMALNNLIQRPVRHYAVYRGTTLVLLMEDRPGQLHSLAGPGPAGLPPHPFLHAQAFDALSEHELGTILRKCDSFDDYTARLVEAGYNLLAAAPLNKNRATAPLRLQKEDGPPLAVLAPGAGQFAALAWQPTADTFLSHYVTATAYLPTIATWLWLQIEAAGTWDALVERVTKAYQLK